MLKVLLLLGASCRLEALPAEVRAAATLSSFSSVPTLEAATVSPREQRRLAHIAQIELAAPDFMKEVRAAMQSGDNACDTKCWDDKFNHMRLQMDGLNPRYTQDARSGYHSEGASPYACCALPRVCLGVSVCMFLPGPFAFTASPPYAQHTFLGRAALRREGRLLCSMTRPP